MSCFRKVPEFLCHIKYKTVVPDPPVDSILVIPNPDLSAFVPYRASVLEQQHQYDVPFNILSAEGLANFVDLEKFNKKVSPEQQNITNADYEKPKTLDSIIPTKESISRKKSLGNLDISSLLHHSDHSISKGEDETLKSRISKQESTNILSSPLKLNNEKELADYIEESFCWSPQLSDLKHPNKTNVHAVSSYSVCPILPLSNECLMECFFDVNFKPSNDEIPNFTVNSEEYSILYAPNGGITTRSDSTNDYEINSSHPKVRLFIPLDSAAESEYIPFNEFKTFTDERYCTRQDGSSVIYLPENQKGDDGEAPITTNTNTNTNVDIDCLIMSERVKLVKCKDSFRKDRYRVKVNRI